MYAAKVSFYYLPLQFIIIISYRPSHEPPCCYNSYNLIKSDCLRLCRCSLSAAIPPWKCIGTGGGAEEYTSNLDEALEFREELLGSKADAESIARSRRSVGSVSMIYSCSVWKSNYLSRTRSIASY